MSGAVENGPCTIGVLGPLEVRVAGTPVEVRTGRLRSVLAALAMSAGHAVTTEHIAAAVWGSRLPANVRRSVQTYVARLRTLLGAALIHTRLGGYVLAIEPDEVDALRFLRLAEHAAAEPDPAAQRTLLVEALELWRGTPFEDVPSVRLAETESDRLVERFLSVIEQRIDLDLAARSHAHLVTELTELTARYPLRESLWVRLLIALDLCGRPAEALARYDTIRVRLATELGTDPGPELQAAFAKLLAGQPADGTPSLPPPVTPGTDLDHPVPMQLPADATAFVGRESIMDTLDALVPGLAADRCAAPVLAVVHGTAGVGKTALAVHWAHTAGDRFPDGQLYANLRGWATTEPAVPLEVLGGFLRALGDPPDRRPSTVEEAAARYRTLLTGKRVLVLLDNARDADQVRPLLPASGQSLVLVTSRDRLTGLVAREGAVRIAAGVLTEPESVRLLRSTLPPGRADAELDALASLAAACAHLPLALRIAAANLADRPDTAIAEYLVELASGDRLGALRVDGDPDNAVRAAFALSYTALAPDAQRMFRCIGLMVEHDVTPAAAAAAAAVPIACARDLLRRLTGAALLTEHCADRFAPHDLLRLFATECADHDPEGEHAAMRARSLRWWLAGVCAAVTALDPDAPRLAPELPSAPDQAQLIRFDDQVSALDWLTTEQANVVEIVAHTAVQGPWPVAWGLATSMCGYFWRKPSPAGWPAVAQAGLAAADHDGDPRARAATRMDLADMYRRRSRYDEAVALLTEARELCERGGWDAGAARALGVLSSVRWMQGDLTAAAEHGRAALELCRRTGWTAGQSSNLGRLGMVYWSLGRLADAAEHHEQALALDKSTGNRVNEAHALGNLGETYHALGRAEAALRQLTDALALRGELGDVGGQAEAYANLARLHLDRGDRAAAVHCGTSALTAARRTGEPRLEAEVLNTLGAIDMVEPDHQAAMEHMTQALRLAQSTATTSAEVNALLGLAAARLHLGETGVAGDHATHALKVAADAGYRLAEGQAMTMCARIWHAQGDQEAALRWACDALAVHEETGHRPGTARTLLLLAAVATAQGAMDQARQHRARAAEMITYLGLPGLATTV